MAWHDTSTASSSMMAIGTNSRWFSSAKNSAPLTKAPQVSSVRAPSATRASSAWSANSSRIAPRPEAWLAA